MPSLVGSEMCIRDRVLTLSQAVEESSPESDFGFFKCFSSVDQLLKDVLKTFVDIRSGASRMAIIKDGIAILKQLKTIFQQCFGISEIDSSSYLSQFQNIDYEMIESKLTKLSEEKLEILEKNGIFEKISKVFANIQNDIQNMNLQGQIKNGLDLYQAFQEAIALLDD
eukprot:TRINITY_DN2677_c0_g1_i2.p1 TRINITY_DN2677_c0_g1~~TRINITY_DN2677_c0_g1_i2.p1  ORF type:complete len:168 (-),score=47.77 TRINITY_DN2677_c0_g1_i2:180-683(-)